MQEKTNAVQDVIVRADAKGKILDFRNSLVAAYPEHYAMLHGKGGKDFAPVSTIQISLTDYSGGTGESSVYVKANIPPEELECVRAVCAKNFGTVVVPAREGGWHRFYSSLQKARMVFEAVSKLLRKILTVCAYGMKDEAESKSIWKMLGTEIQKVFVEVFQTSEDETPMVDTLPFETDYNYHQERVNIYSKDDAGYVRVATLDITRTGRMEKTGEVKKLPWTVKIANFRALPKEHDNGTISYQSSSVTDKKEAWIMVSDKDMHRCCYRVEHFISVWENMVPGPVVRTACIEKEKARQAAAEAAASDQRY